MDDLEDDPEALKDRFQRAADRMRKNTALSLSNEQKLQLYGYFKQANEGPCNMGKPGFFDFAGRAKWDAWKKLGDVSKENAMEQYIGLVSSVDPNWETTELDPSRLPSKESSGDMGGPSVSRYAEEKEEVVPDDQKTAFDWCKEGHVTRLAAMVTEDNINEKDEQGMALLHWACDRGHVDVVKLLVSKGADINTQDSDLQTPLHYGLHFIQLHEGKAELTFVQPNKAEAWERGLSLPLLPSQFQLRMDIAITPASSCDQRVVVLYLLSAGADASVKDCDGATAVEVANSPSTKELFPRQS